MTLKEMPKVGDKVRYIGKTGAVNEDVTYGTIYTISEMHRIGPIFIDDSGEEETIIHGRNFDKFEFVTEPVELAEETPVEASPTVIELLANITRRLYEAEGALKLKSDEISLLHDIGVLLRDRVFELERQNSEQANEINELYKAVADCG